MQSCSELNEFMPILTATNGLAYCVLKGQLSCHKGAAVCQDTWALGGRGYREASLGRASWAGLQGLAGHGYRGASWAGLQGAAGQDYKGGLADLPMD